MNTTNVEFYRRIEVERFKEYARLIGLEDAADVKSIYPFLQDKQNLLEIGAGYGRVVQALLALHYAGRLTALERSPELVNHLRRTCPPQVNVLEGNYMDFDPGFAPDAILWMWSGILELSKDEQAHTVAHLAGKLAPNGLLVAEIPKEIKVVGTQMADRTIKVETEWGTFQAYMPTHEEMEEYAHKAGFANIETVPYLTDKGFQRVAYLMRK